MLVWLKSGLIFSLIALFSTAFASRDEGNPVFTENKGQWNSSVLYRIALRGGYAYIEPDGISLMMLENNFYNHLHDWIQGKDTVGISPYHTLKFKFEGGSGSANQTDAFEAIPQTENYFLGNDRSKWVSHAKSFKRLKKTELYPHIDLSYSSNKGNLKYDFIVKPGGNTDQIQIRIEGADQIELVDKELRIHTSVGMLTELRPFAYQELAGRITEVACEYVLNNGIVSYRFPNGYDSLHTLVIDPEIEFSTFIGSISSNFGFTASYDNTGHLYSGAIVFGAAYPTTVGAAQVTYAGGTIDCGITKFSPDGTSLVYSTFIGGNGNESPHSIVVNDQDELYIFGTTSSGNFPVSIGAFQWFFNGGVDANANGYSYANGCDIFVTKLSADGSDLIASTYVGGSDNDGIGSGTQLDFNYGDLFRGEIVVDAEGSAYVASTTRSSNFPIVNGFDPTYSGTTSGVVFKLSANLQNMIWSTFTGGNGTGAAYSVQLAGDGTVYFTGGTMSNNLPAGNGVQPFYAGNVDGFIGRLSANGSQLLGMTYNGTTSFDQNYFVQIDTDGFVYVIGQTQGNYPVSPGVYSNANSGQYIHKLSPDLSTTIWSTKIGSGDGINISPSAFLVSNCGQIYISGWGGSINNSIGNTFGLSVTTDAFQSTTDGNDFYLAVLDTDAQALEYATFFGGSTSLEHVDGGTSRFDKNGTVYQAVCAGCGGNSDFPTQPGVWSQTNQSSNCNIGVIKFALGAVDAVADINAPNIVCPGTTFDLLNLSQGADQFHWDLGDGTESDATALSHSYTEPGTYQISLLAEASNGCLLPDSVSLTILVSPPPVIDVDPVEPICSGDELQLNAAGTALTWQWLQNNLVSNPNQANPFFIGTASAALQVVGYNTCGTDTASVEIIVGSEDFSLNEDTDLCPGNSVNLVATGGATYNWTPTTGLSNPNIANPIASPLITTTYQVEITTADGCSATESVTITLLPPAPILSGSTNYISCNGASVQMAVFGATNYQWSPSVGLNNSTVGNPTANVTENSNYTVVGSNVCGSDELEIEIAISEISVHIDADTLVCFKQPFSLHGSGATQYIWQPSSMVLNPYSQHTDAIIEQSTTISLTGINEHGCMDTETLLVHLFPRDSFWAGRDKVIRYGEEVELEAFSLLPISWDPTPWLSCLICNNPIANPPESTEFVASILTDYNCREVDTVQVFVRGNIYVPNAFSPDGDGLNEIFKAEGVDITSFKMEIFDRWGELIFLSEDINHGWNGASMDRSYYSPAGVYPYRIVASEKFGELFELKGMVVLLR